MFSTLLSFAGLGLRTGSLRQGFNSFSTSAIVHFPKLKTHHGAKKRWKAISSGKFKRVRVLPRPYLIFILNRLGFHNEIWMYYLYGRLYFHLGFWLYSTRCTESILGHSTLKSLASTLSSPSGPPIARSHQLVFIPSYNLPHFPAILHRCCNQGKAGHSHLNVHKSQDRINRLGQTAYSHGAQTKVLKRVLPYA